MLPINPFSRPGTPRGDLWGIVWHWTGNAGQGRTGVERYFEMLAGQDYTDDREDRYASAHYIIGEDGVSYIIPIDEIAYHAGARWWNHHTIGIEVCHPDWTGRFPEQTLEYLFDTTAFLLKEFKLDINRIRRHYDITGKLCPKWFVENHEEYIKAKSEVARRL